MKLFQKGNTLAATILNIIGLTFAFSALYIIIVQAHYDFTYNHGIKDSERVYALTHIDWFEEGKYSTYVNRPTSEELIRNIPSIESGGIVEPFGNECFVYLSENEDIEPLNMTISNASLGGVETMGYESIEGSWEKWKGESIAISESTANKLGVHVGDDIFMKSNNFFSDQNLRRKNIAVVYKDFPNNSDFSLHDAIDNIEDWNIDAQDEWSYKYFIKLKAGVSEEEVNKAINDYFNREKGNASEEDDMISQLGWRLFPIKDIYFNPIVISPGLNGNKTTSFSLIGIAILVAVIAFINYFNFFIALIPVKLKDINIRKILGSSRRRLIFSVITESLCFVIIALGLGAVLVVIFSHSSYTHLISTSVLFKYHWGMTFITIGAAMVIAILSSLFPAFYITSFNTALAMKGFIDSSSRGNAFRAGLIGFQFTISIILIICAIVINQQRNYMINHDLGFNRNNLLTVEVTSTIADKAEVVGNRLKEDPTISDVTWADGPIVAKERMGWGRIYNGENISFQTYPVAWNFLEFMNIPIVEGRDFVKSDEEVESGLFIFNEEARNKFGFKIGERFDGHRGDAEVVGFAKDFNYMPLSDPEGAFCFYIFGKYPWRSLRQLYVRTEPGADPISVRERIKHILTEFDPVRNEELWNVEIFNDSIEQFYIKEKNLSRLINLFTLLAIVISLMGVFGLVMFDTERRKKEIGIRRVNGASIEEILGMFNLKFIKIVIFSFIIAIPLSWWILSVYLESYAYRTPIYIWVFFVALLAVLIITSGVVTLRSYRAATANPIEDLTME